jgi:hypothetical protein
MHTEQTPVANISYFAPFLTLLEITHILSTEKYIADLIVCLCNTSWRDIKKQGVLGDFLAKKIYEPGNTIDRDLPYKINNK